MVAGRGDPPGKIGVRRGEELLDLATAVVVWAEKSGNQESYRRFP